MLSEIAERIVRDIIDIHYNIISGDTFNIIAATIPPFMAARMIDDDIHSHFYCRRHHKNKCQLPSWCTEFARHVIGIPVAFFAIQALFAKDDELRVASELFLVGFPFLVFGNNILKKVDCRCGLRPWNEHFSCVKRASGGCPSGHVAEATFVATLFGLRFGPVYAVPLGAIAVFVAGTFISCNRHYFSQVIAGAGLGCIYAVAANKTIDARLGDNLRLGFAVCDNGMPALSLAYRF